MTWRRRRKEKRRSPELPKAANDWMQENTFLQNELIAHPRLSCCKEVTSGPETKCAQIPFVNL